MKRVVFLLPLLFLVACDDSSNTPRVGQQISEEQLRLKRFANCAEIEKALQLERSSGDQVENSAAADAIQIAPTDASSGSVAAPLGETNIQTAGVDELDVAKAHNDFIYMVEDSNTLTVLRRLPADRVSVLQRIDMEKRILHGLFLTENQVVVLSTQYSYAWDEVGGKLSPFLLTGLANIRGSSIICDGPGCGGGPSDFSQVLAVTYFERGNDGTLTSKGERLIEGRFTAARLIEDRVHLVSSTIVRPSAEEGGDIKLPRTTYQGVDETFSSCSNILHQPAIFIENAYRYTPDNLLCTLTIDLGSPERKPSSECVISASGAIVYASTKNLFVSSYGWEGTPIHQFQLGSQDQDTKYVGTAVVPGHLLNQFSMDEFDGYLRVATTTRNVVDLSEDRRTNTISELNIFKVSGEVPVKVANLGGLGAGERIYAARFLGKQGYIVTFKKVDPLYAIDLSDPESPVLKGELKIPGYSSYLHPMQEGYLLAVGKDAEAAQESDAFAWYQGMAMSIFDVRDLSDPKLLHKIGIGSRGTSSQALNDHKAFRYIPDKDLVVFPINLYEGGTGQNDFGNPVFSGFHFYSAKISDGFALVGDSPFPDSPQPRYSFQGAGGRSFYKDGIVDLIGGGELVLREASNPGSDLARIGIQ